MTFREYLKKEGVSYGSAEQRSHLYHLYKLAYHKDYSRQYRKKHYHLSLLLTQEEGAQLEVLARYRGEKRTVFVRSLIQRELGSHYIYHPKELKILIDLCRKTSSNINQLVKYAHADSKVTLRDVQHLTQEILNIEEAISKSLIKNSKYDG